MENTLTFSEKCTLKAKKLREEKLRIYGPIADYIDQVICEYFNCTIDDIKSKRRFKKITKPRQFAMFFCGKHTDLGITLIGERYSFNHDIAHYYINKTKFDIQYDPERRKIFKELDPKIKSYIKNLF